MSMRSFARLAVLVTCLVPALRSAGEEPGLNCRDGGNAEPRLLLVQNLWGLRAYPAADTEWPDERKVQEIAAAGFDAFDVWVGGAKEADLARWKALGDAHRLGVGVEFGPERAEDADAAIAAAKRLGSVYLDAHVASAFTPEKEAEALLRALVERCRAASMPLVVQTHRGRVTQDLLRTVAYARAIPDLRFDLDLSHYFVAGEMGGPLSPEAEAAIGALLERATMLDGRISNGEQVQVDHLNPAYREPTERTAALWKRVMTGWLRGARRGDVFPFRVELGPPGYAILGSDGREISDRWEQQKSLLHLVETLWNEAVAETGAGERHASRARTASATR
jgi:sugar phosphate isomerase/epimerase